jgi:hypothetical protein
MGGTDVGSEEDGQVAKVLLPDGTEIDVPLLTDAAGCRFLDIRKLQPTCVYRYKLQFVRRNLCLYALTLRTSV